MDEDYFLHLTDVGREVAEKIYERHCFFTEQLIAAGVDPETAEADACRLEHCISDESFLKLQRKMPSAPKRSAVLWNMPRAFRPFEPMVLAEQKMRR